MKTSTKSQQVPSVLTVVTLFIFAITLASTIRGQSSTPLSPEQQQLIRAQTENYHAQTAKINEERSVWHKVLSFSAFIAALVAVLSLVLNYSSTLRAQRDTQLYEALKRFGDKDSPTVRLSAAGLLAKLSQQRGILFRWQRPNFDIILEQLMAGFLLEENSVCLDSIIQAVTRLTHHDPASVLAKIGPSNIRIQKDLVSVLARMFALSKLEQTVALKFGEAWHGASALTPYEGFALHTLAVRYTDDFEREFQGFAQEYKSMADATLVELFAQAQRDLDVIAYRLSLNVRLYSELLRANILDRLRPQSGQRTQPSSEAGSNMNLEEVFLVGADLTKAALRRVNFSRAQLQAVDLRGADLFEAQFYDAYLQGATLNFANMEGAKLGHAQLQPFKLKKQVGRLRDTISTVVRELNLPPLPLEKATTLYQTDLRRAQMGNANLQGARAEAVILKDAELRGAKLFSLNISKLLYKDQSADFENANWWEADFSDAPQGEYFHLGENIDTKLLDELFQRYGQQIPNELNVHGSVSRFLQEKERLPENQSESTTES